MNGTDNQARPGGPLNPKRIPPDELARILSAVGGKPVDVGRIRTDLAAGAPQNADGTVNLVHYAAWLARETARGD